jgi:hypothetical protein
VGEGLGEGDFEIRKPLVLEITLTPARSHEYVGEGEKSRTRFINRAFSKRLK